MDDAPHLTGMNRAVGIDHALISTVNEIKGWAKKAFHPGPREEIEDLTFFIPWDIERNIPKGMVDATGIFLETLWVA